MTFVRPKSIDSILTTPCWLPLAPFGSSLAFYIYIYISLFFVICWLPLVSFGYLLAPCLLSLALFGSLLASYYIAPFWLLVALGAGIIWPRSSCRADVYTLQYSLPTGAVPGQYSLPIMFYRKNSLHPSDI